MHPGYAGLNTLRLLRAFRVLRLFGRLASLRRIINALMMSIYPVANAFLIMLLVIAIYSILAVEFFSLWVGPEPEFFPVGDLFFGTFSKSMFSLFQVKTPKTSSPEPRALFQAKTPINDLEPAP